MQRNYYQIEIVTWNLTELKTSQINQEGNDLEPWNIHDTCEIRHVRNCWRSKDELISDVFLSTHTHGHASVGQPAKTFLHWLCVDTGCNLEDLLGMMDDRDRCWERKSENFVLSTWLDYDEYECFVLSISISSTEYVYCSIFLSFFQVESIRKWICSFLHQMLCLLPVVLGVLLKISQCQCLHNCRWV